MATLTAFLMEQRDDTASQGAPAKGDYFFLFENQVENRFAKPRREPRRKRIFRRFSRPARSKDWRRTRMIPYDHPSPDTTALMSEDEHSLIHSYVSGGLYEDDDESMISESHPRIIWPETMSLVGDESSPAVSPRRENRKRKVLMKKWKSRMRKSLRDALANKSHSFESEEDDDEYAAEVQEGDDDAKSSMSLLERAKRSLGVSGRSKGAQRAKAILFQEDIGLYVNSKDDEVETVYKSTFEQLCVPSFGEQRDSPPSLPETVSLDNGYAIAHLMYQGKTSLAVNYDSDFAQLELHSDDEHDPEDDDVSFVDDPALPELPASESEETEYNLFNQSSVEEDAGPHERYPSLLAPTSTVSEDHSLFGDASALRLAWPLPQCRNVHPEVGTSTSSDDAPLFVQESTSSEEYSVSSRCLGAARAVYPSVKKQRKQQEDVDSSSSGEEEYRLGISCPAYAAKTTLEDAVDVWKRTYAPPVDAPPSPTIVQKSRATWGCGLDASPISVKSDITESDVPTCNNPFYNIRRYAASCGAVEEEEHPFDEVDSNVCAPRPLRPQAPERRPSFGCGVTEIVQCINMAHKKDERELLGHSVVTNEKKPVRPHCECVKCSVTNMYVNLLAAKK